MKLIVRMAVKMTDATIDMMRCPRCDWKFGIKMVVPCEDHC